MQHNAYITPNEILADVLSLIKDKEMRQNTPGWYRSQVEQSLQELGFDTLYSLYTQINTFGTNPVNPFALPMGCISVKELYAFIGDCCDTTIFTPVRWKRNFNDSPNGSGRGTFERRNIYFENSIPFANIYSGGIHFNEVCFTVYEHYKLIYHGVLMDLEDCPIVPLFARQGIKWWVIYNAIPTLMDFGRDMGLRTLYAEATKHVQDDMDGEWHKAIRRSQQMSEYERREMRAYYSTMVVQ